MIQRPLQPRQHARLAANYLAPFQEPLHIAVRQNALRRPGQMHIRAGEAHHDILPDQPLEGILRGARRLVLLGLAMTLSSGALMFLTGPLHYYANPAFDLKMQLLIAALGLQALIFLVLGSRPGIPLPVARVGVSLSIVAWLAVSVAARAIAFV